MTSPTFVLIGMMTTLALAASTMLSMAQPTGDSNMNADAPTAITTTATAIDDGDRTIRFWPADRNARENERAIEDDLVDNVSSERLRALHTILATRPHRAGTEGDRRATEAMAALFNMLGLDVQRQELWVYLSDPVSANVEIISPEKRTLPIREDNVEGDPYLDDPDLEFGFNAYGASGDVTGEIVYANYGRKEDFAQLRELGIDCTGKIVLARYGGNYRGYKAKFAEEAGAIGLIIYTDPGDAGFSRGEMYPNGGWANPSLIQRGSILTLDYAGDPLTPFHPSTKDADRLDPADVALPKIPVQPVGWNAAAQIIRLMTGEDVPDDDWKGGLPYSYRLTGGPDLRVHLHVEQKRELKKVENVLATLPGSTYPDEKIIIGAHHDAWEFGAGDPTSGTIVVFELARLFAENARRGHWPKRSLVFACWAAEEYGIIGSTEWVEANANDLTANAVAYLNLDMASMGLNFGSGAAPLLKDVILDASRYVPQPVKNEDTGEVTLSNQSVFEATLARANAEHDDNPLTEPSLGSLGGGSDHVGFYCYLGIPSAGLSAHGAPGTSYHSNYDNLHWYRAIVGDDYESPALVAGVCALTAWRLANAPVIPYSPARYAEDTRQHLDGLMRSAAAAGLIKEDESIETLDQLRAKIDAFEAHAEQVMNHIQAGVKDRSLSAEQLAAVNDQLIALERIWIREEGIPGRPWYRSLFAATDEDSGYASWMLPALRYAVEHRDRELFDRALGWYVDVFNALDAQLTAIDAGN